MTEAVQAAVDQLLEKWPDLSKRERLAGFQALPRDKADDLFLALSSLQQFELLHEVPEGERRIWMRLLPPDDAADVIQLASRTSGRSYSRNSIRWPVAKLQRCSRTKRMRPAD